MKPIIVWSLVAIIAAILPTRAHSGLADAPKAALADGDEIRLGYDF